jgi:glycine cleavage system H protein
MKEINELVLPEDLLFNESHEWAKIDGGKARVGISDYAQSQLGDIVFVELPAVGDSLEKGREFGTVESVKAVAEIYAPVSGEVTAVNEELVDAPELINKDPYGRGWMIELASVDAAGARDLLNPGDYRERLKGQG